MVNPNPLSPLVAEIFMSRFETNLQNYCDFPRFWFRYVDDISAVCKARKVNLFLHVLNSQHDTIKFTMENEVDDVIPFLDITYYVHWRMVGWMSTYIVTQQAPHGLLLLADSAHHLRTQKDDLYFF